MTTEYTLEDLVDTSSSSAAPTTEATEAAADAAGDDEMGEYLWKITKRLDERGYLGPLLGLEQAGGAPQQTAPDGRRQIESADVQEAGADDVQEAGADLDSEKVHQLLLQLYDHAGDIPMVSDDPTVSELIQLVETHPGAVDQLIATHL